jgi:cysteine desulfurase
MIAYLDFNASAPIDKKVLEYMVEVYQNHFGNANSRTHVFGTTAKGIVESSRQTIADILSIDKTDLIFTSGSTESNNMSVLGMLDYTKTSGRNHFITTSIEHKSILEPMKYLQKYGCKVDFISPNETGRIKVDDVLSKISDKTAMVSVMHVNSETGTIQPVHEIGEALSKTHIYFHIDATQSFGKLNEELRNLKYDMMSITAHKIRGPQGIGALILRRKNYNRPPIRPLMLGGSQERSFRPGTTPVALVAGFALAAKLCEENHKKHVSGCKKIKDSFLKAIQGLAYQLNGDPNYCIPNTINLSFKGIDAESVFVALKDKYAFSNGSACTSGSFSPSYVLTAMGLDTERIHSALRLSWDYDTEVDFAEFVQFIKSQL